MMIFFMDLKMEKMSDEDAYKLELYELQDLEDMIELMREIGVHGYI